MRFPNVIFLSTDEPENAALQRILSESAMLTPVKALTGLFSVLEQDDYDAVFCGWSFHEGNWNAVLEEVQQRCPEVPVIIFCRKGGEEEWVEALEAGAFDLLAPPYQTSTVIPVLEHAVASREARRWHDAKFKKRR